MTKKPDPNRSPGNSSLIAEAITEAFGERCPDFEPDCWCCKAWAAFDAIRAREAELVEALKPFAARGDSEGYIKSAPDHGRCTPRSFTAGDYRRARALTEPQQETEDTGKE